MKPLTTLYILLDSDFCAQRSLQVGLSCFCQPEGTVQKIKLIGDKDLHT